MFSLTELPMAFDESTTYPLDLTEEDEEDNEDNETSFSGLPQMDDAPEDNDQEEAETNAYVLLQKWEGFVLKADANSFTVRLFDSAGQRKSHQALFARTELSDDSQDLIEEGALLVWLIGLRQIGVRRRRESEIYVRRLPTWEEAEIQAARERAEELHGRIGWE